MASSSALKSIPAMVRRSMSAQAAAATSVNNAAAGQLQVEVLPNNATICSTELPSVNHVATLALVFGRGSRCETYADAGLFHAFKQAFELSSKIYSQLSTRRYVQQSGSPGLTVTMDREYIICAYQCLVDEEEQVRSVFFDKIMQPIYKGPEVGKLAKSINEEVAGLSDEQKVVDLIHAAAYKSGGLGNPLFMPGCGSPPTPTRLAELSAQLLKTDASDIGLVTVNTNVHGAKPVLAKFQSGSGLQVQPAKYVGGKEIRQDKQNCSGATVCLSLEGVPKANFKDILICNILRRILGGQNHVKYGPPSGRLGQVVSGTSASAVGCHRHYADTGLFGSIISIADSQTDGDKVVRGVAQALRSLDAKLTEKDVAVAKLAVESDLRFQQFGSSSALAHTVAKQIVSHKVVKNVDDLVGDLNAISLAEIKGVAKKISGGNFSMAAIGNLQSVPYVDEL